MQQAVLAIEDQSFYSHPGVNPFRTIAAAIGSLFSRGRPSGASTITQQLSRMFFLEDEFNEELQSGTVSPLRKAREIVMSLVLERRTSKEEILELYLNDVYLGQRGSFAVHGVAEASRIFFGKDVANLDLSEAALIAGVIQSPARRSPFANPKAAVERRNVVLQAMAAENYITDVEAAKASREPLQVVARSVDNEAPYFVDMVGAQVTEQFPGLTTQPGTVDVYTTLDLNMQRAALDAVRNGLANVDKLLSRRKKKPQSAQAVLLAVDPRSGEILALVGGRSYNQSQYNRITEARRQPGSVFKPFVYLAAFEHAALEGWTDLTPASLTKDEPAIFSFRRPGVGAEELRRVRRRGHAASRARHVAQPRHDSRRRTHWLRQDRVAVAPGRRRHDAKGLSVNHARRVRADAAGSGRGVHAVHQWRLGAIAAGDRSRAGRDESAEARRVETAERRAERHDVSRHQHDAQCASTKVPERRRAPTASPSMPPARAAPRTTSAMRGSSASRRSCSRWCGWASTTISRWA
jgi:hypothetical protein